MYDESIEGGGLGVQHARGNGGGDGDLGVKCGGDGGGQDEVDM